MGGAKETFPKRGGARTEEGGEGQDQAQDPEGELVTPCAERGGGFVFFPAPET